MTGERLKNIGLKKDVWKELSELAIERECTLSQAVEYLLERRKEQDAKPNRGTGKVGREPRD